MDSASAPACSSAAAATLRAAAASPSRSSALASAASACWSATPASVEADSKASYLLSSARSVVCMVAVVSSTDSIPSASTRAAKPWSSGLYW